MEPTLTDRETVEARFGDFYRAEYPAAVRLAATLTLSSGAEDVVQEAFARVFKRFDDLDRPAAYLRVTVVSVVHETHRRRSRERNRLERIGPHIHPDMPQETHVVDVLARLPFRQRSVLVLRYWADWSEVDIATALGCRPGTVKSLASRALDALSKELGP